MGEIASPIEIIALKKLAVICGALGKTLKGQAGREQIALTSVLVEVINRLELEERAMATRPTTHKGERG